MSKKKRKGRCKKKYVVKNHKTSLRCSFHASEYESSKTQKENLKCMLRKTFKQSIITTTRTSTKLVEEIIGDDLEITAQLSFGM